MIYFTPKPDIEKLTKYVITDDSPERMEEIKDEANSGGIPVVLDRYSTDEQVEGIETGFESIMEEYNLLNHFQNLFFLCLLKLQEIDAMLDTSYDQYIMNSRIKELAQVLLAFKTKKPRKPIQLSLKTYTDSVKVNDQQLVDWFGTLIIEAIEQRKEPLSLFLGMFDHKMGESIKGASRSLNEDVLKKVANRRLPSFEKANKLQAAELCLFLHPYLVNETGIRPDQSTLISDEQARLYFDILTLFKFIDPRKIQAEKKDYIRTLLKNNLKLLTT